jgi:hypothetical protein
MNNDVVLAEADERANLLASQGKEAAALRSAAAAAYLDTWERAEEKSEEALALYDRAQAATGDEQNRLMFEAAMASVQAREALQTAESAEALMERLDLLQKERDAMAKAARNRNDSLRNALSGNNYDAAVAALKREKAVRETESKQSLRFEPLEVIRLEGIQAQNEASKKMERAAAARAAASESKALLTTKEGQRKTAKGKQADAIDAEIARLREESDDLERAANRIFKDADRLQQEAYDLTRQYDILVAIKELALAADPAPSKTDPLALAHERKTTGITERMRSIQPNEALVAIYVRNNPQALASAGSDAVQRAFAAMYLGDDETMLLAQAKPATATANAQSQLSQHAQSTADTSHKPADTAQTNATKSTARPTAQGPKPDRISESTGMEETAPKMPLINENTTEPADAQEPAMANVTPTTKTTQADPQYERKPGADAATVSTEPEMPATAQEVTMPRAEEPTQATFGAAVENPSKLADASLDEQMARAEAARDWVTILDESIAELRSGRGKESPAERQKQIEAYEQLRTAQLNIIAEAEAATAAITGVAPSSLQESATTQTSPTPANAVDSTVDGPSTSNTPVSESIPEQAALSPEERKAQAIALAELEFDALTPAAMSRMESKAADSYKEPRYLNALRQAMPNYLRELAAVELSGLSNPELVLSRAAHNEAAIAQLQEAIERLEAAGKDAEVLRELRHIKVIELREDKAIAAGLIEYTHRSDEAKEYAAMLAANSETEEPAKTNAKPLETTPAISPEMARTLAEPYSRESLLPGYDELIAPTTATNSARDVQRRIDANQRLMAALQDEISLFAAASKAPGSEQLSSVKLRYEELLAERSTLAEELAADSRLLKELNTAPLAQAPIAQATVAQTVSPDRAQPSTATTPGLSPNAPKVTATTPRNADIKAAFAERERQIRAQNASTAELNTALAQLHLDHARALEEEADRLADAMEAATTDQERDELQLAIQELTNLAADRLQEADRLDTEETAASDGPTTQPAPTQAQAPDAAQMLADAGALRETITETVELGDMAYQSLSANMRNPQLGASLEALRSKQTQAAAHLKAYSEAKTSAEKARHFDAFMESATAIAALQNQVKDEISKSNEAETNFYAANNQQLIDALGTRSPLTASEQVELEALVNRNKSLLQQEAEVRSRLAAMTDAPGSDRNALLRGEMMLLSELAQVNSRLNQLDEQSRSRKLGATAQPQAAKSASYPIERSEEGARPLPQKTYITPVVAKYDASLQPGEREAIQAQHTLLQVGTQWVGTGTDQKSETLIAERTAVDPVGMKILRQNPIQMRYLTAQLQSDSLRALEYSLADLQQEWTIQAGERFDEAARLSALANLENEPKEKDSLTQRSQRLAAEAEVLYKQAAVAATQAEKAREARMEQQRIMAKAAGEIHPAELAGMDAILKGEPYKVITAQLTDAPATTPTAAVAQASETPRPRELDLADATAAASAATNLAKRTDDKPVATFWLNAVEIIAEKTDFSDVRGTMYVKAEAPVYSAAKPIPIDPPMPGGLVFQVQVGAFRNPIPQDLFAGFAPVMGQRLDNGIVRYRVGLFPVYRDAMAARDAIRAMGYNDAFVVAYLDGEKLSPQEARYIIQQTEATTATGNETAQAAPTTGTAASQTNTTPKASSQASAPDTGSAATERVTAQPVTASATAPAANGDALNYYTDPTAARAEQVERTQGLFYTVQVGVYSKPVSLDKLYNLTELNTELLTEGKIRYTSGRFTTLADAGTRKQEAIAKGVADAFVTAYFNGRRIPITEATAILQQRGPAVLSQNETPTSAAPAAGVNNWVVVLGVFDGAVPQQLANMFLERTDLGIRRLETTGAASVYASPTFAERQSAESYLRMAQEAGATDAYIATVDQPLQKR